MKKSNIVPTVFTKTKKEFAKRFALVTSLTTVIQIDFMNNTFVKGKTVDLKTIPDLHKHINKFQAHLMVNQPLFWIPKLKRKGFHTVIFHIESCKTDVQVKRVIAAIKKEKMVPGITLNAETPLATILPYLSRIKLVQFMGIHAGKEHLSFDKKVYTKIKELKKRAPKLIMQVDGGATPLVTKQLAKLGINYVSSGSFIHKSKHPEKALAQLQKAYDNAN